MSPKKLVFPILSLFVFLLLTAATSALYFQDTVNAPFIAWPDEMERLLLSRVTGKSSIIISGRVTDRIGGGPVSGVLVTANPVGGYVLGIDVIGQGSITKYPDKQYYSPGESVVLTEYPAPDWVFGGWSGDLGGSNNPAEILMDSHKFITATFTSTAAPLQRQELTEPSQIPDYFEAITDANGYYTIILPEIFWGFPLPYHLTPSKEDFQFDPPQRVVVAPNGASDQDFILERGVSAIDFRPNRDGFRFQNTSEKGGLFEFDDMRRLFGDEAVCYSVTDQHCNRKLSAVTYYNSREFRKKLNGANCGGFTAASLLLFEGLGAEDVDAPTDFGGAQSTFSILAQNTDIWRYIIINQRKQVYPPVKDLRTESLNNDTPFEILNRLINGLGSEDGVFSLEIWESDLVHRSGHALVPYAVVMAGGGKYHVYVYDSNHPADQSPYANHQYVEIDTSNGEGTWEYDHHNSIGKWSGGTISIGLTRVDSFVAQSSCPWCGFDEKTSQANNEIILESLGDADLLIITSSGKRIGSINGSFVDEVVDGYANWIPDGSGNPSAPIFHLSANDTYSIRVEGGSRSQTGPLDLLQMGPGFLAHLEKIKVEPGSGDQLQIASDGTSVNYNASQSQEFDLTLVLETAGGENLLEVQGADVSSGEDIVISSDPQTNIFTFDNSSAGDGVYDIQIRLHDGGVERTFAHANLAIGATDTHQVDFSDWDGESPLIMAIDEGSDGHIDETIELSNQEVRISELRISHPASDNDEYVELAAASGSSLDGLTYVVLGDDDSGATDSGVIEAVVDLSGQVVPSSGFFVVAEPGFTLGTPNFATALNFENDDNVTHLLVEDFGSTLGDDLDADDDGVLEVEPWARVVDRIALIKEANPPASTEYHYGPPVLGPDGVAVPGHALVCADGWRISALDSGRDTPGAENACSIAPTSYTLYLPSILR